jgi:hypothetical protein
VTQSDISAIRNAATPLLAYLPAAGWLPHALVRKQNGELDKPPAEGAVTNNAATWFSLEDALNRLITKPMVAGIGFPIVKGLITLDFDHCRDKFTGELAEEVQVALEHYNSFAYVTPSGTGIRIVGLNDTAAPIPGQKVVRWLPGGHKIEFFIGPTNHYNTFTASVLPGHETVRDISTETLEYLSCLDGGRKTPSGETHTVSNPDPQRSIAAIRAALAVIPNSKQNWDEWNRIGMAVWRSSGGHGEGLDAWHDWSVQNPSYGMKDNCEDRWQNYFNSPPTKIGFGTLYYEARKIRPFFVPPFDPVPNGHDTDTGPDDTDAGKPPPIPLILTMRQLDALPPPEWLVQGLVPEKSLVVAFGPPKAFKSFVALSLALHVADNKPWFGYTVRQGVAVYVAGEGTGGLSTRLRAMRTAYDISIDAPLFIIRKAVNFRDHAAVQALAKLIRETVGDGVPVRMVVIDTLARAMPGADENSAQEVGLVIAECDWLKEDLDTTIMLVHHSGKDESKGARGTSALRGAWDTAFEIRSAGKRRAMMTVVDQKEAEAGQQFVFRMDEVAVGLGRTSLVPMVDETPETPEMDDRRQEPTGLTKIALDVLRNLIAGPEGGILPPLSGLPANDTRGAPHESWRRDFYQKMPGETAARKRLAFWRSSQKLEQLHFICMREPWVWLI